MRPNWDGTLGSLDPAPARTYKKARVAEAGLRIFEGRRGGADLAAARGFGHAAG